MENNQTKICPKCKIEKEIFLFSNNKNRRDGKACYCKMCDKEYKDNNPSPIPTSYLVVDTKICTNCKTNKSPLLFHKDRTRKDGLCDTCKQCVKDYQDERKRILKEKYVVVEKKVCTKCKYDKPSNQFYRDNLSPCRLSNQCRSCAKTYNDRLTIEVYSLVFSKICSICKVDKKSSFFNKNKRSLDGLNTKCKDCCREYRIKNKEVLSAKHRIYLQSEKGKASHKNARYRRRSIIKSGTVTNYQLGELLKKSKSCYWCGAKLCNTKTHIDHYIPLSKGGIHSFDNLVVSCNFCNMKKHAKDPLEFANSIGKLL